MRKLIAIAASLTGLALVLFAGAPAQADEYGSRARRHHVVRAYVGCERVVVRETGYRYYPRAQLYSWEPVEYTRVYCAPAVAMR